MPCPCDPGVSLFYRLETKAKYVTFHDPSGSPVEPGMEFMGQGCLG